MSIIDTADLEVIEPLSGWMGRMVHSESMSFMHYTVGSEALPIPDHSHPQEEVWIILDGEFEVAVDGTTGTVGPGFVVSVPANAPHAIRPLTGGSTIVVNYPLRVSLSGT